MGHRDGPMEEADYRAEQDTMAEAEYLSNLEKERLSSFYGNIKDYVSYSQISTFLKSKNDFKKRYFEGKEGFSSKEISFGKMIHSQIETGEIKMPDTFYGKEFEKEFNFDLGQGIKVLAFIDSITIQEDPIFGNEVDIFEFKTGKVPWVQSKADMITKKENIADDHLQLWIYAMIIYKTYGVIPKVKLIYIPTKNDDLGSIELVGSVKCFEVNITLEKIQETEKLIIKTVQDIEIAYQEWLLSKEEKFDTTIYDNYASLMKQKKTLEEQIETARLEIAEKVPDSGILLENISVSVKSEEYYPYSDELSKDLEKFDKEVKKEQKEFLLGFKKSKTLLEFESNVEIRKNQEEKILKKITKKKLTITTK